MEKVVILSVARTPIGKYKGSLAPFSATALGKIAAQAAITRAQLAPEKIDQVFIGNVLSAGSGQNIARQIALNSGLPATVPATTINEVCGSGMKAMILAMQQIQLGQAQVVLAGGSESMTQAPLLQKYQADQDTWSKPVASMINDGLTDAFSGQPMGLTAENVAQQFQVSRQAQDQFAWESQQKAATARKKHKFTAEIIPVDLADGTQLTQDEGIREATTMEKLQTLRTVFAEKGTVTAGNASTINDGAAMLVLAAESYAVANDLPYLAIVEGYSEIGMDPALMGIAPIEAIKKLLRQQQLTVADIDLFEINEAFAASSITVAQQLALPAEKVNIYGGGISLGHPIGASGARIIATLISALQQEEKETGIASLCIGGGLGLAVLLKKKPSVPDASQSKKFYQLTPQERLTQLQETGQLSAEQVRILAEQNGLSPEIANQMIENHIGEIELPLGVVPNFLINRKKITVPLATEEASVIAAASNAAKIIAQSGGFVTTTAERLMRGQIVLQNVQDPVQIEELVEEHQAELFRLAAAAYPSIVKRGGGLRNLQTRRLADGNSCFLSIDALVDTKDAMGANIINTILEGVAQSLREWLPNAEILFSILSNFPTEAITTASCQIPFDLLATQTLAGQKVAENIVQAAAYAQLDPYRAATHNKGIMNGIDAVVAATGNDTRATAAGCHAYAARDGQYRGLTSWHIQQETLLGTLSLPLAIGTAGGATKVLPKAQIALQLLGDPTAAELAEIITAVGLGQNLAALKALVTDGIQKGHMHLHMRSLAISAGAVGPEIPQVAQQLQSSTQRNLAEAQLLLQQLRK